MRAISTTIYHKFERKYCIPLTVRGRPRTIAALQKAIYSHEKRLSDRGLLKGAALYFTETVNMGALLAAIHELASGEPAQVQIDHVACCSTVENESSSSESTGSHHPCESAIAHHAERKGPP